MPIEIVFSEGYDTVRAATREAFAEVGFHVSAPPLAPGVTLQAKMDIMLAERGNKVLSMFLPFIFKTEALAATVAAYQDGTTAVNLRESGAFGGNLANGAVTAIGGGSSVVGAIGSAAGSLAAQGVDHAAKQSALHKRLCEVETRLREKLAGKIAYEGPPRPGVAQVPA